MATKNRMPVLIRTIENISSGKEGLRILRRELTPPAEQFNRRIVDWLQAKKYPLRRGTIDYPETDERLDPAYGQTPTERLHPGSPPLWQAQQMRIRKQRGVMSLNVIFENLAEHAKLFFNENRPHLIAPTGDREHLKFWSGLPLPWMPPNVRKWPDEPGTFFPQLVEHPGHMNYANLIHEIFRMEYRRPFARAISKATKLVGVDAIRRALR